MIQEIAAALVLGFFVYLLSCKRSDGKNGDQEWIDQMERHKRGEE